MLRDYLTRLRGQSLAKPALPETAPVGAEDFELFRTGSAEAQSSGWKFRIELAKQPSGFLTEQTANALRDLLGSSPSDAQSSLLRLTRWQPAMGKNGKPLPMSGDDRQSCADDVKRIVRYIASRQQPLIHGENGMGKIFFANLNLAMKERGTHDPVALLEQFDTLPDAVRNHFNPAERDALSHAAIRDKTIPVARDYIALQRLSLTLRNEAAAVLGDAMQPEPVTREPLGSRKSWSSNEGRFATDHTNGRWTTGGGSRNDSRNHNGNAGGR